MMLSPWIPGALLGALLGVAVAQAGEPAPAVAPGASPAAGRPRAAAAEASAPADPTPKEMVLCRSPRGAVFARDAAVGCKLGARLTPENLIDFRGRDGCILRPIDPAKNTTCGAECRSADPASDCVVGLRRGMDGAWGTFPPEALLADPETEGPPAQAVCCR